MLRVTKLVGLVSLLLLSINAHAENWYQIEIVVFRQYAPNSENFSQYQSSINYPGQVRIISDNQMSLAELRHNPIAYTQIKTEDRALNNVYQQLKRRKGFTPLLHYAWVQAIAENDISTAVQINQGNQLEGFLQLQRGDYLHLIADLEYNADGTIYHLSEQRRIKFKEKHYLDHPEFGAITWVSPL